MPRDVGEIFAERVRARLEAMDKSIDWLAKQLEINASGISKVLTEARTPRIDTVFRWADALEVSIDYLIGGDLLEETKDSKQQLKLELIILALSASEPDLRSAIRILSGKRSAALNKNESSSG